MHCKSASCLNSLKLTDKGLHWPDTMDFWAQRARPLQVPNKPALLLRQKTILGWDQESGNMVGTAEHTDGSHRGRAGGGGLAMLLVFGLTLAVFGLLCRALLAGGYVGVDAARMLLGFDAGVGLGLTEVYPVLPYLLGQGIAQAPMLADGAPYYADAFAAAILMAVGYGRLRAAQIGPWMAAVLITALAANPIFLFVATGGSGLALSLLFAYLFARGAGALSRNAYVTGGLLLGLSSAGLVLSTPLGIYLLLVAVPFLLLASRQNVMQGSVNGSYYVAIAVLPVAAVIAASLGFMAAAGDMGAFVRDIAGAPDFFRGEAGGAPWPYLMGASPGAVAGVMLAGLLIAFPVLAFSLSGVFAGLDMLRATALVVVVAMVTGVVTTSLGVLSHPVYLWAFAVPPTLVALERLRHGIGGQTLAVAALVIGIAGGWWLTGLHPTLNLTVWRTEMNGALTDITRVIPGSAEAAPVAQ